MVGVNVEEKMRRYIKLKDFGLSKEITGDMNEDLEMEQIELYLELEIELGRDFQEIYTKVKGEVLEKIDLAESLNSGNEADFTENNVQFPSMIMDMAYDTENLKMSMEEEGLKQGDDPMEVFGREIKRCEEVVRICEAYLRDYPDQTHWFGDGVEKLKMTYKELVNKLKPLMVSTGDFLDDSFNIAKGIKESYESIKKADFTFSKMRKEAKADHEHFFIKQFESILEA